MNTVTRALPQERFQASSISEIAISKPKLINAILIIALLLSAFGVIYLKDVNRRLFIHYQTLQATHDKLYDDWGKLLLEQSTWAAHSRVEKIAEQRLGMSIPGAQEIVVLRLQNNN